VSLKNVWEACAELFRRMFGATRTRTYRPERYYMRGLARSAGAAAQARPQRKPRADLRGRAPTAAIYHRQRSALITDWRRRPTMGAGIDTIAFACPLNRAHRSIMMPRRRPAWTATKMPARRTKEGAIIVRSRVIRSHKHGRRRPVPG
jgi:hypothetical protein